MSTSLHQVREESVNKEVEHPCIWQEEQSHLHLSVTSSANPLLDSLDRSVIREVSNVPVIG